MKSLPETYIKGQFFETCNSSVDAEGHYANSPRFGSNLELLFQAPVRVLKSIFDNKTPRILYYDNALLGTVYKNLDMCV
jgi:hypothetical protein